MIYENTMVSRSVNYGVETLAVSYAQVVDQATSTAGALTTTTPLVDYSPKPGHCPNCNPNRYCPCCGRQLPPCYGDYWYPNNPIYNPPVYLGAAAGQALGVVAGTYMN